MGLVPLIHEHHNVGALVFDLPKGVNIGMKTAPGEFSESRFTFVAGTGFEPATSGL